LQSLLRNKLADIRSSIQQNIEIVRALLSRNKFSELKSLWKVSALKSRQNASENSVSEFFSTAFPPIPGFTG
jgi:hypothetical protein